ncbi:MAG: hypothetical protein H6Q06_973, partial [Acidobacteria bacterium]|nr:hypothetical protein [Acidobacteriota bacterium]
MVIVLFELIPRPPAVRPRQAKSFRRRFERIVRAASGSESAFQSVSRSEFDPGPDCDLDVDSEKTRHEDYPTPRIAGQAEATASSRGRLLKLVAAASQVPCERRSCTNHSANFRTPSWTGV